MSAGLRRLVIAWGTFGILVAADAVSVIACGRKGSSLHGFLGSASTCAFVLAMFESYFGPRVRDRQRQAPPLTPDEVAGAVSRQLRSHLDRDGERVRRCG